jgi:hypothetical protein
MTSAKSPGAGRAHRASVIDQLGRQVAAENNRQAGFAQAPIRAALIGSDLCRDFADLKQRAAPAGLSFDLAVGVMRYTQNWRVLMRLEDALKEGDREALFTDVLPGITERWMWPEALRHITRMKGRAHPSLVLPLHGVWSLHGSYIRAVTNDDLLVIRALRKLLPPIVAARRSSIAASGLRTEDKGPMASHGPRPRRLCTAASCSRLKCRKRPSSSGSITAGTISTMTNISSIAVLSVASR